MQNRKLYDILGVDEKANESEIKEAFKNKAKANHPDKEGGSSEKMQELNNAYAVLKNPARRDKYDKTGEEKEDSFEKLFSDFIQKAFIENIVLTTNDIENTDLLKLFTKHITNVISGNILTIGDTRRQIKRLEEVRTRIKSKEENLVSISLQKNIEVLSYNLKIIEDANDFLRNGIKHVNNCYYDYSN